MKKIIVNSKTERTHTPEKVKVMSSRRKKNGLLIISSFEEIYRQETVDSNNNGFNGLKESDY